MATIEFKVTMADGTVMSRTATMSDEDVARLLAAHASKYPAPMVTQTVTNPETQETTTVQVPGEKTGDYLVSQWIEEFVNSALQFTKSYETRLAADSIGLIPVTIN